MHAEGWLMSDLAYQTMFTLSSASFCASLYVLSFDPQSFIYKEPTPTFGERSGL